MFKKKKITFYCELTGVDAIMPIIPLKQHMFEWRKKAAIRFSALAKESIPIERVSDITRCPGISGITSLGWVIKSWQDIIIETNGDGVSFQWHTPVDQKEISPTKTDYITLHESNNLVSMSDAWPEAALKTIIKINTGWFTVVPKNHTLIQLPVPFSDECNFQAVPGSYSGDLGVASLTVPIYWYTLKKRVLIKAGTPLAQLILVPDHNYDIEVAPAKNNSILDLYRLVMSSSFIFDYNRVKKIISKII